MQVKLLFTLIAVAAGVVVFSASNLKETIANQIEKTFSDQSAEANAEQEHGEHAESPEKAEEHSASAEHHESHKILVTNPEIKTVTITERYVCQIHSRRHIDIQALNEGYLQDVLVNEGQAVTEGQPMFNIVPVLYQARLDSDLAEAQLAQVEYNNTKN
ncbi:MAG: hypothetical protein R3C03_15420 [Pirellulaceae bacterium]